MIENALPHLPGGAREQIESQFSNMLEMARLMWTRQQRSGDVTDYQARIWSLLFRPKVGQFE